MKKHFYLRSLVLFFSCSGLFSAPSFAQLYANTFTGASACPTVGNIPVVPDHATGTEVSRSTMTCTMALNVFNSTTLNNTATINDNSYLQFSVTANAGYKLSVTALRFFIQGSLSAPNQLEVRYSTDDFATNTTWGAAPNTHTSPGGTNTWDFTDFTTSDGGTVTFRIYLFGTARADGDTPASSSSATIRMDNLTLEGSVINPMPVKLTSFIATNNQNRVTLRWSTAWEENNQGFDIEESDDAKNFIKTGYIEGKTTTLLKADYEYSSERLLADQIRYYRLKQIDLDGSFTYSRIISASPEQSFLSKMYVYPNPNNGIFSLANCLQSTGNIKLFTESGEPVPLNISPSQISTDLNIQTEMPLNSGFYQLRIEKARGLYQVFRVFVNR